MPSRQANPAAAPLPYADLRRVEHLAEDGETPFALAPDEAAEARIAAFLGIDGLSGLRFEGGIAPWRGSGWMVSGRLRARLHQTCVVTLEPMETRIDETVSRGYAPGPPAAALPSDLELDEEAMDAPDPLGDAIDLGALMVESLSLLVDPYPRAEGAVFGDRAFAAPGIAPLRDEDLKPFAKLAALKEKLGGTGG